MFEVYRDAQGEWRWHLKASNGRIVADSGEGYKKRSAALTAIERVKKLVAAADVIEKLA